MSAAATGAQSVSNVHRSERSSRIRPPVQLSGARWLPACQQSEKWQRACSGVYATKSTFLENAHGSTAGVPCRLAVRR